MKNTVKKLILIGISVASVSSFAANTKCKLGSICKIPVFPNTLSWEVTPKTGTDYQCVLAAAKERKKNVSIEIYPNGAFEFETLALTADVKNKGFEVKRFSGKFASSDYAEIRVNQIAGEDAGGVIICSKFPPF